MTFHADFIKHKNGQNGSAVVEKILHMFSFKWLKWTKISTIISIEKISKFLLLKLNVFVYYAHYWHTFEL